MFVYKNRIYKINSFELEDEFLKESKLSIDYLLNTTIAGYKISNLYIIPIEEKWSWQIWTKAFYFGGRSVYSTREEAMKALCSAIELNRDK